jgi:hypothetical protein
MGRMSYAGAAIPPMTQVFRKTIIPGAVQFPGPILWGPVSAETPAPA